MCMCTCVRVCVNMWTVGAKRTKFSEDINPHAVLQPAYNRDGHVWVKGNGIREPWQPAKKSKHDNRSISKILSVDKALIYF